MTPCNAQERTLPSTDIEDALSRAQDYQRRGELEAAAAIYRGVLDGSPDHADALYGLGTVNLQARAAAEARPLLARAAALQPEVPEFAFNLALAEERCGAVDAAVRQLQRAASLASADTELLLRVCRTLARLGDWAGACASLRVVVQARPDDAAALRDLATAAGHLRDYATALQAFRRYLSLSEDRAEDQLAYADLLLMARRPQEADDAVERAMALGAQNAEALFLGARCDRLSGNYVRALDRLRRATAQRPAFGNAWWLRLDLERDAATLADIADACHGLARAPATKPRDATLLALTAGRARERLGDFAAAFEDFRFGNGLQHRMLADRGTDYDAAVTESFGARMTTLFAAAPPRSGTGSDAPIFVVGLPRSGTTVVERVLAGLPGVEAGGENEAMEFVASRYYWGLEHGRVSPPASLGTAEAALLAAEYWERTGGRPRRLTDKLPHNFRNVGLIAHVFPDAPIVYLHRDPRDVALSIYARPFPDGHAYACDLAALGHFVAAAERLHAHWKRVMPERILDVRYETLVREPERVSRDIADFCGLPWDPACLEFHRSTDSSFTFSELQVREALNDRGIGRWRRYETQLQPFIEAWERHRP